MPFPGSISPSKSRALSASSGSDFLHLIYNPLEIDPELVNARVTAARWQWSRRDLIKHHYSVEVDHLPVIIQVRKEPAGNFGGGKNFPGSTLGPNAGGWTSL